MSGKYISSKKTWMLRSKITNCAFYWKLISFRSKSELLHLLNSLSVFTSFGIFTWESSHPQRHQEWQYSTGNGWQCQTQYVIHISYGLLIKIQQLGNFSVNFIETIMLRRRNNSTVCIW